MTTSIDRHWSGIAVRNSYDGANPTPLTVDGTVTATPPAATTGTQANVSQSATSTTILAANSNRRGASIFNDAQYVLYLLLSASGTASTTAFTVAIPGGAYYEVPFSYTGLIQGIWGSAGTGAARVTEFT